MNIENKLEQELDELMNKTNRLEKYIDGEAVYYECSDNHIALLKKLNIE